VHTGFWSFIWRDVILRLAPDFRCVCFDAPGTGQSDRLPTAEISLAKASQAVTSVIQTLNLTEITLILHDLGGLTGIAGAACFPERIRGLCAVNAFAWKPTGALFRGMLALVGSVPIREISAWTGILARITSSAFGIGRRMDAASRQAFYDGIGRQGVRAFHSYLRDARKRQSFYEQVERALRGPFSQLPLLTIFGERNDPLGFQPRWKQLFGDASQVVVPEGNHFPMCDDPELVAASIREMYRNRVAPALQGQGDPEREITNCNSTNEKALRL
jgi:haloalkane dehalogenase